MIYEGGIQYPDIASWLAAPPNPIPKPGVPELVALLESSKRARSRGLVLSLLWYADRSDKVDAVYRKMQKCGDWIYGWTTQGYKHQKRSCGWVGCPRCNQRLKWREAKQVWRAIREKCGRRPQRQELSYLTAHFTYAALGEDFSGHRNRFRDTLRKALRKLPASLSLYLQFEIAPQEDRMGKLHAHGWILHPGVDRAEIKRVMSSFFPDHKAVELEVPHSHMVYDEVLNGAEYQADIDLTMKGFSIDTPQVLSDLIHSIETMRSRGRQGLRFKYNMKPIEFVDDDLIESAAISSSGNSQSTGGVCKNSIGQVYTKNCMGPSEDGDPNEDSPARLQGEGNDASKGGTRQELTYPSPLFIFGRQAEGPFRSKESAET